MRKGASKKQVEYLISICSKATGFSLLFIRGPVDTNCQHLPHQTTKTVMIPLQIRVTSIRSEWENYPLGELRNGPHIFPNLLEEPLIKSQICFPI